MSFLYFFINLSAFAVFGIDKFFAIQQTSRIPEKQLFLFIFLGPFGSLFSILIFRHKIRKIKFKVFVLVALIFHIYIISEHLFYL